MLRALNNLTALVVVTAVTPVLAVGIILGALVFLPLPATLPEPRQGFEARATHVLDAAGNEIAVWRQFETSIPVAKDDIPKVLKDAVVAAEDKGFYEHGGIDVPSTVRALWANVRSGTVVQGGSTITQQYVKNAFTTGDRTLSRKVREAILASQLDRQMSKDEILFRYLSSIYFGGGAYGVGAAADTYFNGKVVKDLTLAEAALLAAVIPSPSRYDPRIAPEVAEQRRVLVLDLMLQQGSIDQATHDAAVAEHLWLFAQGGPPPGPATVVYPPQQQVSSQPWFTDYVRQWLEAHLPGCSTGQPCPALDKGGLVVKTTLDPVAQAAATEEIAKTVGDADLDVQMGLTSVEPPTGFVKAMVGGRDYGYSQFNTATNGHQPGSSFKPFVLATAFAAGVQPTKVYSGAPCKTPDGGVINNYGHESFGSLDVRRATWHSVNAVFCRLILDPAVGVDQTMAMARRLGLAETPVFDPAVHGASITLGVTNASPLEMASAYGVFADHGTRADPTPVLQVSDAEGKTLIDNTNAAAAAQPVISETVADNVTDVLRGVLTDGTAHGKGIDRPASGKTGTADDAANAWFVGFTPTLSTAVWMGHLSCGASTPDRDCGLSNIGGVHGEITGGSLPASTWQRYMKRALKDVPATEFLEPAPIQAFADQAKRNARQGFDLLPRRYPSGPIPANGYVEDAPAPIASEPTSSTTSSTSSTTSTTTKPLPTTPPPSTILPN